MPVAVPRTAPKPPKPPTHKQRSLHVGLVRQSRAGYGNVDQVGTETFPRNGDCLPAYIRAISCSDSPAENLLPNRPRSFGRPGQDFGVFLFQQTGSCG